MPNKYYVLYSRSEATYLCGFALPNMPVYNRHLDNALQFNDPEGAEACAISLKLDGQLYCEVEEILA